MAVEGIVQVPPNSTGARLRTQVVDVQPDGLLEHQEVVTLADADGTLAFPSSLGATGDAAVVTDTTGTLSGKLRGLVKWAYERMPASLGQKVRAASLAVTLSTEDMTALTPSGTTTVTGEVEVKNDSGNPLAVSGPVTDTQLRASAVQVATQRGVGYLHLDGVAGSKATTPDTAILDLAGDFDIRIALRPDSWTPLVAQYALAKWNPTGNQRSYAFPLINTDGKLFMAWSNNGVGTLAAGSTVATGFSAGTLHCVRATFDVDNGAAGNTVTFYTKETTPERTDTDLKDDAGWTQLGAPVVQSGVTSVFNSTAVFTLGQLTDQTSPYKGDIYGFALKNAIGLTGKIAAAVDFGDQAEWYFSAITGKSQGDLVFTIAGGAEIRGAPKDEFTSFEAQHVTLAANTDTTITFAQPVRMVRVLNWDTANRLLVKNSVITGASDAAASRVGFAPAASVPGSRTLPYRTTTIHVQSPGTGEVTVEGYLSV